MKEHDEQVDRFGHLVDLTVRFGHIISLLVFSFEKTGHFSF